ncbi:thioredoxin [Muribaculaceae bacterium]|jgi:thioredoxin 1|uniref:thioredoxin family protein n=1 Tax=uncultured Duncaniella sp. TaxID=2768039 RepID=UPI000A81EDFA|nr:thioredoxin family protein [uncultured Duncaniella sp.]MCX4260912.1 thioredoxin family protein [Muribaculaceae bacterium]GFI05367.1 thioredoxin [Muribaculaceae bacterium]
MDYNSIINSNNVVLVEFFATWCPHCKRMIPVMEEVKKLLGNRVPVYTIDIDENEKEAEDNKIETIPTFIVYHNGNQVWRHSGEIDKQDLIGHVESLLQ